jgi:phenylacetate-CoA ligase
MSCWNPKIEMMPRDELNNVQLKHLRAFAHKLYDQSHFYRERMVEAGVTPDDLVTLDDAAKLPFMVKKDLREIEQARLFMVSNNELVRYHASSGTTGRPTIVGYTQHDIDQWCESVARGLMSAGISQQDIIQISYTYGLFTGGLGLHYGAERIGATVVPASTGNTERQIDLLKSLGVTAMACTPSYMMYLGETAQRMGVSIKDDTKLNIGILGAEPWSEGMRERMQDWLGIKAINIYGTSELSGPLWCECSEQAGMHVWSDLTLAEIIDPKTSERLGPGEKGELVITMLQKEALPIIRYRTGDITTLEEERCACGRTHPRIGRITGRVDDMLIIRGINVFPSQVEYSLMTNPEVGNEFQIIVERTGALDDMTVRVELKPEAFTDNMAGIEKVRARVEHKLRSNLNIHANVELVEPGALPRFEGKAKRVIDKRKL